MKFVTKFTGIKRPSLSVCRENENYFYEIQIGPNRFLDFRGE